MKINPVNNLAINCCNTCPYLEKNQYWSCDSYGSYGCLLLGKEQQVTKSMVNSVTSGVYYKLFDECPLKDFNSEQL